MDGLDSNPNSPTYKLHDFGLTLSAYQFFHLENGATSGASLSSSGKSVGVVALGQAPGLQVYLRDGASASWEEPFKGTREGI